MSPKNDGGIRRIILTEGEGPDSPNQGAEVESKIFFLSLHISANQEKQLLVIFFLPY